MNEFSFACFRLFFLILILFLFSRNPNSNTDRYLQNIIWTPMHNDQFNYLDMDDYPTMRDNLNIDRYAIWDRIFPIENIPELAIEEDQVY